MYVYVCVCMCPTVDTIALLYGDLIMRCLPHFSSIFLNNVLSDFRRGMVSESVLDIDSIIPSKSSVRF